MTTPKRIQRRRTKGWTRPAGVVCVDRTSTWGNPWVVNPAADGSYHLARRTGWPSRWPYPGRRYTTREAAALAAVALYRRWVVMTRRPVAVLRGKDLACWCPVLDAAGSRVPCHADVLIELANRGTA